MEIYSQGKPRKDLTGKRFNNLVVLKYVGKNKRRVSLYECKCDCGNIKIVNSSDLVTGHVKSCGCIQKVCIPNYPQYVHEENYRRLYNIWRGMKRRCLDKKSKDFKSYGAKGISVCDEWLNDFEKFYLWALNNGYKKIDKGPGDNLSIDRIDSQKGYCPDNCRWIPARDNSSRVSDVNKELEELMNKSTDEIVKEYIERKMEKNIEIQEEKKKIKQGFFPCRKNTYCILKNNDNTKQFIFKNLKTVGLFLNIANGSISYRLSKKNGRLTDEWKLEKITKEEFDNLRLNGIEVIV